MLIADELLVHCSIHETDSEDTQQAVPDCTASQMLTWIIDLAALHAAAECLLLACPAQKPKEVDLEHLRHLSEQAKVNVPFHSLHPEDAPEQSLLEKADHNLNGASSPRSWAQHLVYLLRGASLARNAGLLCTGTRSGVRSPLLVGFWGGGVYSS